MEQEDKEAEVNLRNVESASVITQNKETVNRIKANVEQKTVKWKEQTKGKGGQGEQRALLIGSKILF